MDIKQFCKQLTTTSMSSFYCGESELNITLQYVTLTWYIIDKTYNQTEIILHVLIK